MKEIESIIRSFKIATHAGKKVALATVVHVEGSSYRRPGARMLVTEDGQLTGAISGGCLEGDALRKALFAISQQQNKLVTYNTMDDDDREFGVQLGCNGIVHILFEPIHPGQKFHPIILLEKALVKRQNAVIATVFSLNDYTGTQPGTCLLYKENEFTGQLDNECSPGIKQDIIKVAETRNSIVNNYEHKSRILTAFIEYLHPSVAIVIAGAGNDVLPLVTMTDVLGWHVTIVDGRPTHATEQRFPTVKKILVGSPEKIVPQLFSDSRTAFILMSHNYNYDKAMLQLLQEKEYAYLGVLGPARKMERMINELAQDGINIREQRMAKIFGPTGLDIGAETSEEIALSVVAEIQKVLTGHSGNPLKYKKGFIHSTQITVATKNVGSQEL